MGKYSAAFQEYLGIGDPNASEEVPDVPEGERAAGRKRGPDHSTYGARHAVHAIPGPIGQLLAFCIAGHLGGLADAGPIGEQATLSHRLDPARRSIEPVTLPSDFASETATPVLNSPLRKAVPGDHLGFTLAFFTRMLFSCLIDADRTATEAFCNPPAAADRGRAKPSLSDLLEALDVYLNQLARGAVKTSVNAVRAGVLSDGLNASALAPGFFSLNVPTGGGKTLASLAFALAHARRHPHIRRVVVGIPFTSIIEQTADVYRDAIGSMADTGLVEHHSSPNPHTETLANRLAAENWDAPLIATTNVQLFESMFAAKTSPARKLHRLANSVIILDESQTMPVDLLTPTLAALKELVARYGCTVVLCTATQPALERRGKEFDIGIEGVRPIVSDVDRLHASLKRVEVTRVGKLSDDELVARLSDERQVLCVVNTKAHAAKLFGLHKVRRSDDKGCYHLSTFMCAEHRRDVLKRVRRRLEKKKSCRVISTQLIEAGVDVDFPCVYRAPAGFDSIAQAAGRCNREGKLTDAEGNPILGRVYVFETEMPVPPGLLRAAANQARELTDTYPDPLDPKAVEAYFRRLYWARKHEWDKHGVMPCFEYVRSNPAHQKLAPFMFRTAAEAYRLIRQEQASVLVPYNAEARAMIETLRSGRPVDYAFLRRAQKYTVSVREDLLRRLTDNHSIVSHEFGLWRLDNEKGYSPEQGMLPDVVGLSPDSLIA